MQRLQVFQRAAGVLQLHVNLAKLHAQPARQIRNRQVSEQVDQDNDLQRLQFRMAGGVGVNIIEIVELNHCSVEHECERRCEECPDRRQQNRCYHDDEWIKEIKRAIESAADVNDGRRHGKIGQDLQH